jgi:hypothetical protein
MLLGRILTQTSIAGNTLAHTEIVPPEIVANSTLATADKGIPPEIEVPS